MFGINRYIIQPTVAGLQAFNKTFSNAAGVTESAHKTYTHLTKMGGASVCSVGFSKGAIDTMEAVACGDKVCTVVSLIGCTADCVGFVTSYIPGANVSTVITIPISVGCKSFVYFCKRSHVTKCF